MKEEAYDYLEENTIKDLVKKYSQFINFPIHLWTSKTEQVRLLPATSSKYVLCTIYIHNNSLSYTYNTGYRVLIGYVIILDHVHCTGHTGECSRIYTFTTRIVHGH